MRFDLFKENDIAIIRFFEKLEQLTQIIKFFIKYDGGD